VFQKQAWMQRAGEYPVDDQGYFSLLARAVFSAGLGPKVVEARWPNMCAAFHYFDPRKVAAMSDADVSQLLSNPNVIRNRRKIEAVIENARRFLSCVAEAGKGFHGYLLGLGAERDLDAVAQKLSQTFVHLGRTSALFFLFSAGWRPQDMTAVQVV